METNKSLKHIELQGQQFPDVTSGKNSNNGVIQIGQMYGTEREPNPQAGRIYSANGISPCLDSCGGGNRMPKIIDHQRARRLTPKETFRLQGWKDEDFYKAQFVNSDSQLYKQSGNGVTVNVIEAIARKFE